MLKNFKLLPIFIVGVIVVMALYVARMIYIEKKVPSSIDYLRIYKPPMPKPTASPNEAGVTCPRDKDLKAGDTFHDCLQDGSKGPEMIVIPAGKFEMGNIKGDHDEQNVHPVSVKKFAMCRYEITFEEYDRFAEATLRKPPYDEGRGRGKFPVINVTWHDAKAYMKWLSEQTGQTYRLPSEAQWEYAARAGTQTKSLLGNANFKSKKTSQVGSFEKNDFGLYDMVGNVWEWVADPYYEDYYSGAPEDEGIWKNGQVGDDRVLRGCSWRNHSRTCRITNRYSPNNPNHKSSSIGFRCSSQITE
jgi:formylglycine-generating enzyme required for sulfatase activity